jgi:hypothetical protein
VTKQEPAGHPAIGVSPSLSLRQAVRPLIFAHALLTREQGLSAQLAEECGKLKKLTTEALEAAALVHLLAPDKSEQADDAAGSRRSQFIDAYAKAGTTWAEATGTAIALADALLDADRPDDARRLAAFLEAADEPAIAKDLRTRADAVAKRALEGRLGRIHADMTESEIADAIDALRECTDAAAANFYMPTLAKAMARVLTKYREEEMFKCNFGTYETEVTWVVSPGDVIQNGTVLFNQRSREGGFHQATFYYPALITKRLLSDRQKVTGLVAAACYIRVPQEIVSEVIQANWNGKISTRLDVLVRVFRQIQVENTKSPQPGE